MHQKTKQQGFTIIEITIAMAFIATLLISVMLVGMQLISLYNKGLTIKDVNTVARHTVRDMQDSVAASKSSIKLVDDSGGYSTNLANASSKGLHYFNSSSGGRLCTGSFTYIWNYQAAFNGYNPGAPAGINGDTQFIRDGAVFKPIRFVKVSDERRDLCSYKDSGADGEQNKGTRIPDSYTSKLQDVFGEGDRNLVLYTFEITSPESLVFTTDNQHEAASVNTNMYSSFYTFSLTVGSSLFPEDVTTTNECAPPPDSKDTYVEYCAINQLDFVARTGQY